MPMHISDDSEPGAPKDVLSKDEIEALIRDLELLRKDFLDISATLDPHLERNLQELAGTDLQTMLKAPEDTLMFLIHPNPKRRKAALTIAYRHWKITKLLASTYEDMAISDSDPGVRNAALRALGTCYHETKDGRIGHLLASIARDQRLPEESRLTAFTSLLRLHGNMEYGVTRGKSPLVPQSLHEIDWEFVDEYYNAPKDAN